MKSHIAIIIDKKSELEEYLRLNLKEVFNGEINFTFYYLSHMENIKESDLVLVMIKERILNILPYINDISKVLSLKRTFEAEIVEKIKDMDEDIDVLVVNDTMDTTIDLVTMLYKLGIKNTKFIPYVDNVCIDNIKFSITANEVHLIPKGMNYLDIGYRPVDISTIIEIISRLNLNFEDYIKKLELYNKKYLSQEKNSINNIYINKKLEKMTKVLQEKNVQRGFNAKYNFTDIKTKSMNLLNTIKKAKRLSKHNINILLYGESGTGKEMFSQAIHNHSERREYPFVGVNITAIPANLLESELFGYVEGAFTGARKGGYKGLFEKCNGGTLFLDEIGDMPKELQTKLLRVIEEKCIMPIGASEFIKVDVRIITATNKNLKDEIKNGNFREDLYYRLKSAVLKLVPLRERKEDIEILTNLFLPNYHIHSEVKDIFEKYKWGGNIREFKNACDYIKIIIDDKFILKKHMPDDILDEVNGLNESMPKVHMLYEKLNISENKLVFVLEAINYLSTNTTSSGRYAVYDYLREKSIQITESELKNIYSILQNESLIISKKGRRGALLTQNGKKLLKDLSLKLESYKGL